jgi:hypothetical protein
MWTGKDVITSGGQGVGAGVGATVGAAVGTGVGMEVGVTGVVSVSFVVVVVLSVCRAR